MQIDLIDMRHRPDGVYNWIGHFMDHWTKIQVLFPQMEKSAAEVALNLSSKVFAYFGPPKILQSDNWREFVNSVVKKLIEEWPGEITIINGRVRHPQSQDLVERGNAKVEEMLASRFHAQRDQQQSQSQDSQQNQWTMWLPEIQCQFCNRGSFHYVVIFFIPTDQLNNSVQRTMKATPYELVFGQPPRTTVFPGVSGLVMEEEVVDILAEEGINFNMFLCYVILHACMYLQYFSLQYYMYINIPLGDVDAIIGFNHARSH